MSRSCRTKGCGSFAINLDPSREYCDVCLRTRQRDEVLKVLRRVAAVFTEVFHSHRPNDPACDCKSCLLAEARKLLERINP